MLCQQLTVLPCVHVAEAPEASPPSVQGTVPLAPRKALPLEPSSNVEGTEPPRPPPAPSPARQRPPPPALSLSNLHFSHILYYFGPVGHFDDREDNTKHLYLGCGVDL